MKDQVLNRNQLPLSYPQWTDSGAIIDLPDALSQQNQVHPGIASFGPSVWQNCPDESKISYYLPPFFAEDSVDQDWLIFERNLLICGDGPVSNCSYNFEFSAPDFAKFTTDFQRAQLQFEAKKLQKIVPVIRTESSINDSLRRFLIGRLLNRSKGLFNYGFWLSDQGMFGKTPEYLLSYSDGVLRTMALAGTRLSTQDKAEFLQDEKERFEHQIVINEIKARLADKWPVEINIGETFIHDIDPLMHLRTDITIEVGHVDFLEAVELLHPTPALGVQPRSQMSQLKSFSPADRGRFGAPFGVYIDSQNWFVLVAIRNFEFRDRDIFLSSGCGIVPQSQLDIEIQELQSKQMAVRKIFGGL